MFALVSIEKSGEREREREKGLHHELEMMNTQRVKFWSLCRGESLTALLSKKRFFNDDDDDDDDDDDVAAVVVGFCRGSDVIVVQDVGGAGRHLPLRVQL